MTRGICSEGGGENFDAALAAVASLFAPAMLYFLGLGALDRYLYPALSVAVGGYLYFKRSPWYVAFCIWLFCATSLIRRLADEQAGWDPSNPILLAPYLACAFALLSLPQATIRPRLSQLLPFLTMLSCIGYGFVLAALNGRVLSGAVDAMKWAVGPLFAIHIIANASRHADLYRVAVFSFLAAAPPMGIYGAFQFISPPPWDADWVVGAASLGLNSIGWPLPFELRVFSTMNSPGSFGIVMTTAILIGLQQKRLLIGLPAVLAMVLGLLLSQYRAVWAGTMIGAVLLIASGPRSTKLRAFVILGALVLAAGSATIVPEMQKAISDRLMTLDNLSADPSGEDRLHQYESFLTDSSDDLVVGNGLAIDGASRRLDHQNDVVIDSGIILIFSAFGVFGGTIFLLALLSSVKTTFSQAPRRACDMSLYRAVAVATFCQLPFGGVNVGESGFGAWLFVGLAVSAIASRESGAHVAGLDASPAHSPSS